MMRGSSFCVSPRSQRRWHFATLLIIALSLLAVHTLPSLFYMTRQNYFLSYKINCVHWMLLIIQSLCELSDFRSFAPLNTCSRRAVLVGIHCGNLHLKTYERHNFIGFHSIGSNGGGNFWYSSLHCRRDPTYATLETIFNVPAFHDQQTLLRLRNRSFYLHYPRLTRVALITHF